MEQRYSVASLGVVSHEGSTVFAGELNRSQWWGFTNHVRYHQEWCPRGIERVFPGDLRIAGRFHDSEVGRVCVVVKRATPWGVLEGLSFVWVTRQLRWCMVSGYRVPDP